MALSRSFRRVEITDARAKRPTMGGSIEPPFLLPQEARTAHQSTLPTSLHTKGPGGATARQRRRNTSGRTLIMAAVTVIIIMAAAVTGLGSVDK